MEQQNEQLNPEEHRELRILEQIYSPTILALISQVLHELDKEEEHAKMQAAYDQIATIAQTTTNGVMLMALVQATLTLLAPAIKLPEPPKEVSTDAEPETPVAAV